MSVDPAQLRPRVAMIDVARGVAILAMIVYHFAWDLSYLGLIDADIRDHPAWVAFARTIAASFLMLAGIGLVLAHGERFAASAFLRRLALVAGAALLVTVATWLILPRAFIFFGILHAIALGSLLAVPFLRLPPLVTLAAAGLVFALPAFFRAEAFSAPWLIWLGLGTRAPTSMDFVPLFPWFGFVLLGVALARSVDIRRLAGIGLARPLRFVARAGRNSLLIYLLHQPILFGGLWLAAQSLQPRADPEAAGFVGACESQCRTAGGGVADCRSLCLCAVERLRAEGLWQAVIADRLDPAQRQRLEAISRNCAGGAEPPR